MHFYDFAYPAEVLCNFVDVMIVTENKCFKTFSNRDIVGVIEWFVAFIYFAFWFNALAVLGLVAWYFGNPSKLK